MDRVNDLVEFRIDAVLQEMSGSTLCVLPEDEPVTCEEFVQTTRVNKYTVCFHKVTVLVCGYSFNKPIFFFGDFCTTCLLDVD